VDFVLRTPLQRIRIGALSLMVVLTIAVVGYKYIGGYDWIEAIWMVVVTVSTVGFSESSESTSTMQIFTVLVILFGVSAGAYTGSGFIQLALEGEIDRVLGKRRMTKEISKLDRHVIICGFGRIGQDLAEQLQHRKIPFVVIDLDAERVEVAREIGSLAIQGDATHEHVLEEAHLSSARALVAGLPSDALNVFITLTARNLHPDIQIIAKSEFDSSLNKFRQAGANKIVMPHRVGAQQMERMISRPSTADLVELFAEVSHIEMELDELLVPKESNLVGLALGESRIKDDFSLLVIGIKDTGGKLHFNPGTDYRIGAGDTLLVIGEVGDINRLKSNRQM